MKNVRLHRALAWLLIATLNFTQVTQVAALTLASTPLAALTTSTVRPNLMYVLDNSGSMAWDYTPDYINDATVTDPLNVGVGPAGTSGDTGLVTLSCGAPPCAPPGGSISAISAVGGNSYYEQPTVVIQGGGGTGAAATANWNSSTKKITSVTVTTGGSGYTTKPFVTFVGKLSSAAWGMCWGTTGTNNQGGAPKDTSAPSPTCTTPSQLPYSTSAINYQYYDPAIHYEAPFKADGTRWPSATFTAASRDAFSGGSTANLTSSVVHEVWCNASNAVPTAGDPTAGGKCRENLNSSPDPTTAVAVADQYTTTFYPDAIYTFRKTYNGPAFYFTMSPSEYCTDDSYTNCTRSTAPVVAGSTVYNVPSYYRWCSYYNPNTHSFGNCQGRRDWSHYIPNYLGSWVSTGTPGQQATAALTITGTPTAGQQLTSVTIGGVNVVGGSTFTSAGSDATDMASQICAAIEANRDSTGYGCSPSGSTATIQAAIVGTAANNLEVVASGPADVSAVNSVASFQVVSALTGARIDSMLVSRADTTTTQLLSSSVNQLNNSIGDTAQAICDAIKGGPGASLYDVRSRDSADFSVAWNTCNTSTNGLVEIRRRDPVATDNGATLVVTGPTGSVGSITVTATAGATRINDILVGGVSVVAGAVTKPWGYADGNQTSTIAADIAAKIGANGCTATAFGNTVSITGTCTGAVTVSSTAAGATGTFRVTTSGSTSGGDLSGIKVGTADVVGHVTKTSITDGTAVAANAATLSGLVGNGFTAAAPVASSGSYDVTVTAPVGNLYNGMGFGFLTGCQPVAGVDPCSAAAGATPQWTFSITGATTDNAHITSMTCGGTTTVPDRNTGATAANVGYVQNLAVGASTNGLNGKSSAGLAGYTYSCSNASVPAPGYRCTVTGPVGVPACGNLSITKDPTISLSTATPAAVGGSAATSPSWTFSITDAQLAGKRISQIRCSDSEPPSPGTSNGFGTRLLNTTASTGSLAPSGSDYASILAAQIMSNTPNTGDWRGSNTSCSSPSAGNMSCKIARSRDGSGDSCNHNPSPANPCAGNSVTVTTSAGATMVVGAVTQHHSDIDTDSTTSGTCRYWYQFDVSNVGPDQSITSIACSGNSSDEALSGTAVTGTSATAKVQYLENLRAGLDGQSRNSFNLSCPTPATDAAGFPCTVTGPSSCTSSNLYFQTPDGFSRIYIDGNQLATARNAGTYTAGSAGGSPTWTFDILDATAGNATISAISCGGSSILPAAAPTTGTNTAAVTTRINNLTGAVASPAAAGNIGPTNGYTLSCQPETSGSAACTLNGPPGVAACNIDAGTGFVINKDSSISVGAITRTSAGSAAGTPAIDFAPYLSTVSTFSGGVAAQSTTTAPMTVLSTIVTSPSPITFSNGSPSATLTIATNTSGTSGFSLNMAGGSNPDVSSNHWSGVGAFQRYDIVATNDSYPRGSGRTDCAGATCTYNEEIQNYANWYSYYRTRMQMMKSTSSIAFSTLDGNYRVGYDDICHSSGTSVIRTVAQFADSGGEVANQKTNWYSSVTSATPSCATPLRQEAAKIGRYFAGKLTGTDPLQYSCQQNFMILVTDGYWNENEPASTSIAATDIGNQDNVISTAARPYYDGAAASTTCPGTGTNRGGTASSCRTLADIAWYYYSTDLRDAAFSNKCNGGLFNSCTDGDANDVSTNNVLTTDEDKNQSQHMNFYAMGLGIDGTVAYRSDYQTAGVGDFAQIRAGTTNWPAVANLDPTGVDDLWHATVNGRGKYFSARNVPNVIAGLREALTKIGSRVGSAAAAATSNLEPVAGDNFAYVASYETVSWVGDLQSRSIDVNTGDVSPDTNCSTSGSGCQWSAQTKLDNQTWSARRIYMAPTSSATGDPLRAFTWDNLSGSQQAYFNPSSLSQYATLSVSNPGDITAENLVNYLRGERRMEQDGNIAHAQIWRRRNHTLGDIVDTQPVYMRSPNKGYSDTGYAAFKSVGTAAARRPVVFVGAQDGMVHAFNADTAAVTMGGSTVQPGEELWAYIPAQSMASMKVLADTNYSLNHRFFIDGPITIADVNFGASTDDWHTILVAGQGAGGTSYFALDVTDPLNPTFLWEFTHATLGYSFANPTVAKLPSGEWVVFFSSGYNNSDGMGYMYALNPKTGALKSGFPMATGTGSALSPVNLGKIGVWVTDPATDNTAQFIYSGGTDGDLWRFDLDPNSTGHSGTAVFKLAHLTDSGGVAQPITTKPELTTSVGGYQLIFVGTGKYLESSDLLDSSVQAFYGIKDTLGDPNLGGSGQQTWHPRTDVLPTDSSVPMFLTRKLIELNEDSLPITVTINGVTRAVRKVCRGPSSTVAVDGACNHEDTTDMDWSAYGGWMVTFPDSGERLNVDMKLVQGTLVFATNVPGASSCTVGGSAWVNFLNYATGLEVQGETNVSIKITDSLVVGITVIRLASGEYKAIATKSNYQQETLNVPVAAVTPPGGVPNSFQNRRSLWREFEAY